MDQLHFSEPVANTTSISDTNDMEIGTASNVSFVRQNDELTASRIVLATPKQKLLTSGLDRSLSHGISLSEHYVLSPRNAFWARVGGDIYRRTNLFKRLRQSDRGDRLGREGSGQFECAHNTPHL